VVWPSPWEPKVSVGKIKETLQSEETETPLQTKLEALSENIGKAGLVAALITLVILLVKWAVDRFAGENPPGWDKSQFSALVRFFITAITIIVVAVPEGLPLAVTLSLAYSMVQMMKDQNLVRHLSACETMGGANAICSDKTGTLTQNRMKVVRLWVAGETYDKIPKKEEVGAEKSLDLLCQGACVNSSAYIEDEDTDHPNFVGSKTDCALLGLSRKFGYDYKKIREDQPADTVFTFSSKKKRMSSAAKGKYYCKGASEVVLELCNKAIDNKDGNENELTEDTKKKYLDTIQKWASEGLRTLCLTYKEAPSNLPKEDAEGKEDNDLILVGIVGIEDPLRPEVKDSVKVCQNAGITIRMLTGDNLLTAKSIGKQCGILTEGGVAIEGPKFRQMSEAEIDKIIPKLQIIARCSPDDKLTLVKRLRTLGGVVAVTGDGTNDAPALKEADVGFAMGIAGTEVAKDASDIILLDDNFSSIEKAVLWGRNVYDSIQKFVQFQLTVNVVAVLVALIGAASGDESPLKAIQLLWVNLIMDTFAALALATEKPQPELMDRKPHGRNARLITLRMWRFVLGHAIFQLGVLFFILYGFQIIPEQYTDFKAVDEEIDGGKSKRLRATILFNAFVFCQLFNEINARRLGNTKNVFAHFFTNWIYIAIWVFTAVVQALLVTFGDSFAQTERLNWKLWLITVSIGALELPWGFLLKFIPIPEEPVGTEEESFKEAGKERTDESAPLLGTQDKRRSSSFSKIDQDQDLEAQHSQGRGWNVVRKKMLPKMKVVAALRRQRTPVNFNISFSRTTSLHNNVDQHYNTHQ